MTVLVLKCTYTVLLFAFLIVIANKITHGKLSRAYLAIARPVEVAADWVNDHLARWLS